MSLINEKIINQELYSNGNDIMIDCIKFNYKNGKKKDVSLCYIGYNLFYSYKNKMRHIVSFDNFEDLKGILYGPKCSTYRFVKDCIPWNCFSLILDNRTFDFQVHKYTDYIRFINKIKIHPKLISIEDMFLEINNDKRLWMNINYNNFLDNKIKNLPEWYKKYNYTNNIIKDEDSNKNKVCCICLDNFENPTSIKVLECKHIFHRNCINLWLKNKTNCPICRKNTKYLN